MSRSYSRSTQFVVIVSFAVLVALLLWTRRSGPVNAETEQQVWELLDAASTNGAPFPWERLEEILGPGTAISVDDYNALTGYDLPTDAAYECRQWTGRGGAWIAVAHEPVANLSSFRSRVR